jgi:hypothetical protein
MISLAVIEMKPVIGGFLVLIARSDFFWARAQRGKNRRTQDD